MKNVFINKEHIVEMYVNDRVNFEHTNDFPFRISHEKGDPIFYFLPRLWRPKYHTETKYHLLFCYDEDYTIEEVYRYLVEHDYYENYNLQKFDDGVFVKPHVVIKLSNGTVYKKYCDTNSGCMSFMSYILEEMNNLIKIII